MTSQKLKHAIDLSSDHQNVEQALAELKIIGSPMNKISVVTTASKTDGSLNNQGKQQSPMTRADGAKAGAITGSVGVGSLTLIVGISSLLIPGVGQALAMESLLTTFLGSGIAATAGGLYGALQGWLVPEEQAKIDRTKAVMMEK